MSGTHPYRPIALAVIFLASFFCSFFSCGAAASAEHGKKGAKRNVPEGIEEKKVPKYAAIQLDQERKVISDEELAELREELQKEAKEAREAAKDRRNQGKRPARRVLKVLRGGFATEAEAEKWLEDFAAKEEARKEAQKEAKAAGKKAKKHEE